MVNYLPTFLQHEGDITMGIYDEMHWSNANAAPLRIELYKAGMAVIKAAEDVAFGKKQDDTISEGGEV